MTQESSAGLAPLNPGGPADWKKLGCHINSHHGTPYCYSQCSLLLRHRGTVAS